MRLVERLCGMRPSCCIRPRTIPGAIPSLENRPAALRAGRHFAVTVNPGDQLRVDQNCVEEPRDSADDGVASAPSSRQNDA